MKSFIRGFLKSLTSHIFLKIVSLVLAIVLWSYIIASTPSLTRAKYVSDLGVSLSGENTLSSYGMAVSTDVYLEYLHQISATVDVSQSQYSKVTNKNIVVTADVSNIRSIGEHEVPLKAVSVYGEVTRIYPDTIMVNVESLDSRDMPIEIDLTGTDGEKYWYDIAADSINPQQVTISGPVSVIENVASVGAVVDVSGFSDDVRRGATLTMRNAAGEVIVSRKATKSTTTCAVFVEIYPKKEYEVMVDASQIKVADGYQIDSIRFQPSSIVVAAEPELLESLEHLPLEIPDNMAELSQSTTQRLSFSGLNEFRYISAKQVYMTVTVSEVRENTTITDVPISVYGLNSAEYEIASLAPATLSVQVNAPRSALENLSAASVDAYVDVTGLTEGNFDLPIIVGSNSDISIVSIMPSALKAEIVKSASQTTEDNR